MALTSLYGLDIFNPVSQAFSPPLPSITPRTEASIIPRVLSLNNILPRQRGGCDDNGGRGGGGGNRGPNRQPSNSPPPADRNPPQLVPLPPPRVITTIASASSTSTKPKPTPTPTPEPPKPKEPESCGMCRNVDEYGGIVCKKKEGGSCKMFAVGWDVDEGGDCRGKEKYFWKEFCGDNGCDSNDTPEGGLRRRSYEEADFRQEPHESRSNSSIPLLEKRQNIITSDITITQIITATRTHYVTKSPSTASSRKAPAVFKDLGTNQRCIPRDSDEPPLTFTSTVTSTVVEAPTGEARAVSSKELNLKATGSGGVRSSVSVEEEPVESGGARGGRGVKRVGVLMTLGVIVGLVL